MKKEPDVLDVYYCRVFMKRMGFEDMIKPLREQGDDVFVETVHKMASQLPVDEE